jgi:hypothetical protein
MQYALRVVCRVTSSCTAIFDQQTRLKTTFGGSCRKGTALIVDGAGRLGYVQYRAGRGGIDYCMTAISQRREVITH